MKRLLLVFACVSTAMATTVTLTMDEVAAQPINGLAVTKGGITFTFSDVGGGLSYDTVGPGILTYEQDPAITGPPDQFGVAFSVPVTTIQFGMSAGPTNASGTPLATVRFYNGATLITTVTLNSSLRDPYPEGQLNYTSATPVTSMTVTPAPDTFAEIGFDNLQVTTPAAPPPAVPATSPVTLALMMLGIVGLGGCALRRRFGLSTSH
jgi:hypothetical protein